MVRFPGPYELYFCPGCASWVASLAKWLFPSAAVDCNGFRGCSMSWRALRCSAPLPAFLRTAVAALAALVLAGTDDNITHFSADVAAGRRQNSLQGRTSLTSAAEHS